MPKPVHIIEGEIALPRGEDAIWSALLDLDARASGAGVSLAVLERATGADEASIREYLRRLGKSGHVRICGTIPARAPSRQPANLYAVATRSLEAPRIRRDGTVVPESAIDRMWRVMRIMRGFSAHDLSEAAQVSVATAERYLRHLCAGDAAVVQHDGQPLARRNYLVIRQLGPRAPRVLQGHVVYDPNARALLGAVETEELAL